MSSHILEVRGLAKQYGSSPLHALEDVSFAIAPQTFTAILGPSGAGKTTLLRCLMKLLAPERGMIQLLGQPLSQQSGRSLRQTRAQVATVAQHFNLVGRRTALENTLAGRLPELPLWRCALGQFPQSLLREGLLALERVQLLDVAFQRADCLSGGQQQRVAIARALTQNAKLVLADEPVASLDPASAHTVLTLLQSLCKQDGLTVICCLHQVDLARQYSDRILGLSGGRLVLDCPAVELDVDAVAALYR